MNLLRGARPSIGPAELSVEPSGAVRAHVGDRPAAAGDGLFTAIASAVAGNQSGGHELHGHERAIAADQTNQSVVVDDRWVVKLVGRWDTGARSRQQLDRLATVGSTDVPAYGGALEWAHPERGTAVIALVTEYVPRAEDGWVWAPPTLLAAADGGTAPPWPTTIGALVARTHVALLGEDAPGTPPHSGERLVELGLAGLDRALAAGHDDAAARRLARRAPALAAAIRSIPPGTPGTTGLVHGDLHLGQLLQDARGRILLIDFDGDPQLTGDDARRTASPAADVAQLIVSIDLAAAVAQRRTGTVVPGIAHAAEHAAVRLIAAYRREAAALGRPDLLDDALLPGLAASRLVAELAYADAFLPRWRYAPDWAITTRYAADPSTDPAPEEPWTPPDFRLTFD